MLTRTVHEDARLSLWLRVREFAVPPSMIETATARRSVGDWGGACAAAGIDIDLNLRAVARVHGRETAARIRADLRRLAPDLLRWHMPRIAPDGLLRPGLTITLARYDTAERDGAGQRDGAGHDGTGPVHLVVRTPPAWADAGQRISLALWDGSLGAPDARRHPHPHPHPRFRLDLHRHLWDARRADELRIRSGADRLPADGRPAHDPDPLGPDPLGMVPLGPVPLGMVPLGMVPQQLRCAVDRWAAEAGIVLQAEGRPASGGVTVRLGARHRLVLHPAPDAHPHPYPATDGGGRPLPVLPDAATWVLPDLDLLRAGAIEVDRLHPLVASALAPDHSSPGSSLSPDRAGQPRLVECRGAQHRIGLVDGVLVPLDHDPVEIRREELLVALTGTPLPCLQVIDMTHRHPDAIDGVRERLDHGDTAGALAVVEGLLGPDTLLRSGDLRDELEAATLRRISYGLFRTGLLGPEPDPVRPDRRRSRGHRSRGHRSRPRPGSPR
ncbi:hypothetical protein [Streptacidiphilus sp. PAMC 29251]